MGKFLDDEPKSGGGKFLEPTLAETQDSTIKNGPGRGEGPSLLERMPSANREFLRSLGTGEDGVDAYMRGMDAPSESETFQNQLLRQTNEFMDTTPLAGSTLARFMAGIPGSAAGKAADIVTNPVEALLTAAGDITPAQAGGAIKSVAKGVANAPGALARVMSGPKVKPGDILSAMENEKELAKAWLGPDGVIDRAHAADSAGINARFISLKNAAKTKLDTFLGKVPASAPEEVTIPKLADKATLDNRENYVALAQDISENFGAAYEKALPKDAMMKTEKAADLMNEALTETGILTKPEAQLSSSEKKVVDYYLSIRDAAKGSKEVTPVTEIPVSKFDQDVQRILQSKAGQKYGSGDHVFTVLREKMSDFLSDKYPGVRVVRAKFRPVLQMKNEAYKIFDPFNRSGAFDTTRGANFFSRYVNGMLKPDEMRLIEGMKTKFGPDLFKPLEDAARTKNQLISELGNLDVTHQAELAGVQSAHDITRAQTQMNEAEHLSSLDALLQDSLRHQSQHDFIKKTATQVAVTGLLGSVAGLGFSKGASVLKKFLPHGV